MKVASLKEGEALDLVTACQDQLNDAKSRLPLRRQTSTYNRGVLRRRSSVGQISNITRLKRLMCGDPGESIHPDPNNIEVLTKYLLDVEFLTDAIDFLDKLSFHTGNDLVDIFNKFIRNVEEDDLVSYMVQNERLFAVLVKGFQITQKGAQYALVLTELFKISARVCWLFLKEHGGLMDAFFDYMNSKEFQKSSDALTCFRVLLTKHPTVSAQYLQENYEPFFRKMDVLIDSQNYITKRQSLRSLGELLVIREHIDTMKRFLEDEQNLVKMMTLLKSKSRALQFEAFHIFKLFIANPHKPDPILQIILGNREKMMLFLRNFQTKRDDRDARFKEDKDLLIEQLEQMGEEDESRPDLVDKLSTLDDMLDVPAVSKPYGVPQTITEDMGFVDHESNPLPDPSETWHKPVHRTMGSFGPVLTLPSEGLPIHSTNSPTHKSTNSSFGSWKAGGHNRLETPLAGSATHPGLKDRRISEIIDIDNHKRIMSVEFPDLPD